VSDERKAAHPEIPRRELAGVRVVLAHAYHHIDQGIIGATAVRVARHRAPSHLRPVLEGVVHAEKITVVVHVPCVP
jgi:uncharacterized protein with HEPN domain